MLNLHKKPIFDEKGEYMGEAGIFTDVTQNRFLIDRLEKKAGMVMS